MSQSYDIIIVGAGIVGAACARECARNGLRTLVLERGFSGGGTTAAGMGHVVVMDDSEAQFALTHYSRRLWSELSPNLPRDVEYDACGTLWLAADEEEMAEARRKEQYYKERGVWVEMVDPARLAVLEPNLRPGLAGGVLVPDDAVVYPPSATQYFLQAAQGFGARVVSRAEVTSLQPEGIVRLADGTSHSAGRIVVATGPWSPELVPGLPVRKRKGHLVITDRDRDLCAGKSWSWVISRAPIPWIIARWRSTSSRGSRGRC